MARYGIACALFIMLVLGLAPRIKLKLHQSAHESTYDVNGLGAGDTVYLQDRKWIISELTILDSIGSGWIKLQEIEY